MIVGLGELVARGVGLVYGVIPSVDVTPDFSRVTTRTAAEAIYRSNGWLGSLGSGYAGNGEEEDGLDGEEGKEGGWEMHC